MAAPIARAARELGFAQRNLDISREARAAEGRGVAVFDARLLAAAACGVAADTAARRLGLTVGAEGFDDDFYP